MPSFKRGDVKHPIIADQTDAYYRFGAKDYCFGGTIELGGERIQVEVAVPRDFVRLLGTVLADKRLDLSDDNHDRYGHALWHIMNRDREFPCSSCSADEEKRQKSRDDAIDGELTLPKLASGIEGDSE